MINNVSQVNQGSQAYTKFHSKNIQYSNNPLQNNSLIQSSSVLEKDSYKSAFLRNISSLSKIQPVSFGYNFKLKEQIGLPCPCCGNTMISIPEAIIFADEMENATGNKLISGLKKYKNVLPQTEKKVADMLIELAKDNKSLTLDKLIQIKQPQALKRLEFKQKCKLEEIADLAVDLKVETQEKLYSELEAVNKIVEEGKNGAPFKRKTLLAGLQKFIAQEANKENKMVLRNIADKAREMPTSGSDVDAFIVKYSRRNSRDIAERLIFPSCATTEHIKPHDNGGQDSPENYLSECNKCNGDRNKTSYAKWVAIHPEMIINTQKYMDEVMDRIIEGKIENFDYYPKAVKLALYKESKQALLIDISRMDNYMNKKYPNNNAEGDLSFGGLKLNTIG